MNTYRDIIKEQISLVSKKKINDAERSEYWSYIIGELVKDLVDYEGRQRWSREPRDLAWKKYGKRVPTIDEIIRHFFGDDFFRI